MSTITKIKNATTYKEVSEGEFSRVVRNELGLTQVQLAKKLQMHVASSRKELKPS